jgi:ubiquitin carboxyl-terminal hydrolase 5/13
MAPEALVDRVRAHMRAVKKPSHYDKVYKDECSFSYATPEALEGLFINMQTWQVGLRQRSCRQHAAPRTRQ